MCCGLLILPFTFGKTKPLDHILTYMKQTKNTYTQSYTPTPEHINTQIHSGCTRTHGIHINGWFLLFLYRCSLGTAYYTFIFRCFLLTGLIYMVCKASWPKLSIGKILEIIILSDHPHKSLRFFGCSLYCLILGKIIQKVFFVSSVRKKVLVRKKISVFSLFISKV